MYKNYIKRILDILFATSLIPFVSPIIIIFSCLIKLEDKGPILYCGNRIGKNGKVFKMYKFRSMKVNAIDIRNTDGSTYNSNNDYRLTKVGAFMRKTSIDEIPQIFNVISGKMSFIGPRPDLPDQLNKYSNYEKQKLKVRPGISGYSQAFFRNSISAEEKFKNDVFYVNKINMAFDLKILVVTIISVFKRENINVKMENKNLVDEKIR